MTRKNSWEHEIVEMNGKQLKTIFSIKRTDVTARGGGYYFPEMPVNEKRYETRDEATDALKLYLKDLPKEEKNLHRVAPSSVPLQELRRYFPNPSSWCYIEDKPAPAKFTKDEIYQARYIGDSDLVAYYEVQRRTTKRMTLQNLHEDHVFTVGIKTDDQGNEYCHPEGTHPICLVLRAENVTF